MFIGCYANWWNLRALYAEFWEQRLELPTDGLFWVHAISTRLIWLIASYRRQQRTCRLVRYNIPTCRRPLRFSATTTHSTFLRRVQSKLFCARYLCNIDCVLPSHYFESHFRLPRSRNARFPGKCDASLQGDGIVQSMCQPMHLHLHGEYFEDHAFFYLLKGHFIFERLS